MMPLAQDFIQLAIRTNLMFFYFEGLYYHLPKRAAGIRYVFIGKPMNQRPRYFYYLFAYLLSMPRSRRRVRKIDVQEAPNADLERQLHDTEMRLVEATQQGNSQRVIYRRQFQADSQRIAALEGQIVELTGDHDGFHQRAIDLEGQMTGLTDERDTTRQRVTLVEGELVGVTQQRD
ncbi:hypothetical protein PR202_gb21597 [Eleusine coracana subsp. coracana]|uniref:RING-type E3 ubiquitin transferase n=1 Tax=Eleusine coracana subsp. coracana TaxID=191504 RepID=A0AAV5FF62_ELECO|nr:hypothetical protein PR202_gb21597 [Eleusine coracana subsp. coracana]